jgi:catechol 2,3-dioxygenase-like lactoylglutathione lyase family enzyme
MPDRERPVPPPGAAAAAPARSWRVIRLHHVAFAARLHHAAFEVSDIDEAVADLRSRGVRMVDETPRPGGMGTRIAFVHPAVCPGLLLELVESPSAGSADPNDQMAERS